MGGQCLTECLGCLAGTAGSVWAVSGSVWEIETTRGRGGYGCPEKTSCPRPAQIEAGDLAPLPTPGHLGAVHRETRQELRARWPPTAQIGGAQGVYECRHASPGPALRARPRMAQGGCPGLAVGGPLGRPVGGPDRRRNWAR